MSKSTKRSALAAIAALPLVVGLAACGGGKTETSTSGESGSEGTASEEEGSSGSNKLTVWTWDPAFNIYAMEEAGKIYKESHPDFELEVIETPWDDIQTKFTTLSQSREIEELPDIVLVQNNASQLNLINSPELFVPLTDGPIKFDEFPAGVVAYSTLDGQNFGVPFDAGTAINALRIDVLEEAGLSIDDFKDITWDKYMELGKQVLEKTGKPLLSGVRGEADIVMMILQSAGASLFDAEGNPTLNDDAVKQAVQQYTDLVESGVMVEASSWDEYIASFINGDVAGTINGVWIVGSIRTAENQSGMWEVTNLPKLEGVSGATNYSANGGSSWMVTANADKELAMDFLAETFAGSEQLYDTILPTAGAVANWLPAAKSAVYKEPVPFFNDQPVFEMVVEFGANVPSNNTGVYYYEARNAVGVAASEVIGGADLDSALQAAQEKVEFAMQ